MCEIVIISPDGSSWLMSLSAEQLQCMTVLRFKEELLKMCATRGYTKDDVKLLVDGKPLDDDCAPVTNYGIKPGSTVQMVIKVHGGGPNLPVYSKSSTEDLTVRQSGHTKDDVKLHFEGKPLDDDSEALSNRGIKHGSTVQMVIKVHGGGPNLPVYSKSSTEDLTVRRFKKKPLEGRTFLGYTKDDVKLLVDGKPLDDEYAPVTNYGIKPGSTVQMVIKVHGGGPNLPVYSKSSTEDLTVRQFKKKPLEGRTFLGHTKDDVKLHFEGKPLDDDCEALSNRGIKHGSTVQMTENLEGSQVRLQNKAMYEAPDVSPGGQRWLNQPVYFKSSLEDLTVRRFKKEMPKGSPFTGLTKDDVKLHFEGKPLDDDSEALSNRGIKHGSTVQMCPGCRSTVTRENGSDLNVLCKVCTAVKGRPFEFCWQCLREWKGPRPRKDRCENDGCCNQSLKTL